MVTAAIQATWMARPMERLEDYLALWIGAAAINVSVIGVEIYARTLAARSGIARRKRCSRSSNSCRR